MSREQRLVPLLRVPLIIASICTLCTADPVQAGTVVEESQWQEVLRRLDAAESKVGSLHKELDEAKKEVLLLRTQMEVLQSKGPSDSAGPSDEDRPGTTQDEQTPLKSDPLSDGQTAGATPLPPEVIKAGQTAFVNRCTECHEASRALEKRKDLGRWRKLVRRMARKRSADIPQADWEPIAVYLASVAGLEPTGAAVVSGGHTATPQTEAPAEHFGLLGGNLELDGTVSTTWRGSEHAKDDLENRGFVPEVWFGGEWNAPDNPMRIRMHGCITCHVEGAEANRIDLAEGAVIFDIHRAFDEQNDNWKASVQGGRFIVPFGAFSQQSHPASFRTVTKPLLFNMGQNVNRDDLGPPLLPMPYSDEGVMANVSVPLHGDVSVTADGFVVNGLQGDTGGVSFFQSRSYSDNNAEPAFGGRVTAGTPNIRAGCSFMAGKFNDDDVTGILDRDLEYEIFGFDVTIRHEDLIRLYFEYAARTSDRFLFLSGMPAQVVDEEIRGLAVEGELRLLERPRTALVGRYDMFDRRGDLVPTGSSLSDPDFDVHRATWGFTITLPGGSMLLLNHEHWFMPHELDDVDVIGARWVGTFSAP